MTNSEIIIESPLKDQWGIFNPPGHAKLAYDFIAVDDHKSPYKSKGMFGHIMTFISVENTYAWSKSIISPVDGIVVASSDGEKDRVRINMIYDLFRLLISKPNESDGFSAFGGNHVIIKHRECFLLFAHLKEGSVSVKPGDEVNEGMKIGEVGNSGSSLQPHLHFQIMENESPFPLFKNLLPFKLNHGKRKVGNEWKKIYEMELNNGDHLIFE